MMFSNHAQRLAWREGDEPEMLHAQGGKPR